MCCCYSQKFNRAFFEDYVEIEDFMADPGTYTWEKTASGGPQDQLTTQAEYNRRLLEEKPLYFNKYRSVGRSIANGSTTVL